MMNVKKLRRLLISSMLSVLLACPVTSFAQEGGGGDGDPLVEQTMNDVMIVAGAGAAGAVLGLSTLSFVDNPSKHIRNIMVGAAFGIIAGVIFVAYNQAGQAKDYLGQYSPTVNPEWREFGSVSRIQWHYESQEKIQPQASLQQVGWSFQF